MDLHEQHQQQAPSLIKSVLGFKELDPYTKSRNGAVFRMGATYGTVLTFLGFCTLLITLVVLNYAPGPSPTPPLHFNIRSFNLSSSSSIAVVFSVHNPLPFPLHVFLARASVSRSHRLYATGFVHSFRVPTMTPERAITVSADLPSSIPHSPGLVVGLEFEMDGLVRIREGSKHQRMRAMKVVCNDMEALLVGGSKKCVQSWGFIH